MIKSLAAALLLATLASPAFAAPRPAGIPHLQAHGTTRQLVVDGKPFLILGGELSNSSASSLAYLDTLWPGLATTGLNTVFAPVEWDQLEPQPGHFDFVRVDGLVAQARRHHVHLVLLWFGAWKNSMSTYAPPYIKHDSTTYPKAYDAKGEVQDILSPFGAETLKADSRAFAALMAHLKRTDVARTVMMVQVENEIGMLPVVRDYGPRAQAAFDEPVPSALIAYMQTHVDSLAPGLAALWQAHGRREAGTWTEVLGGTVEAQEIFQAWAFAAYADAVARAGKAQYPLPMYVNAALMRPGRAPGEYPSAGPLPHLFDVWKAGAPDIDVLAPDIYFPNFSEWADRFKRPDNPLLTPEANQAGQPEAAANAFYAVGQLDAISFSPFAIDQLKPADAGNLSGVYDLMTQLEPLILDAQGTGRMHGFRPRVAFDGTVDETPQSFVLGDYRFTVTFIDPWTPKTQQDVAANGGLIIQTGDNSFIVAGTGVVLTFADAKDPGLKAGIEQIIEGDYVNGAWHPGRWLNGDESHQGRHLRIAPGRFDIQHLTLYAYP